jgi:hypothetical protein
VLGFVLAGDARAARVVDQIATASGLEAMRP